MSFKIIGIGLGSIVIFALFCEFMAYNYGPRKKKRLELKRAEKIQAIKLRGKRKATPKFTPPKFYKNYEPTSKR